MDAGTAIYVLACVGESTSNNAPELLFDTASKR